MKKIAAFLLFTSFNSILFAQIEAPKASPLAKVEQKVGLTSVTIDYSRPSKNNRVIFGDVVPYNEMWRTGANENSKITISDAIVFGTDTLKAGTYAIFTKPTEKSWEIYFYLDITNWGTPDVWDDKNVALKVVAPVSTLNDAVETFTISIDNITTKQASLNFSWDKTRASTNFTVPTDAKMNSSITKVMSGPTANDYFAAAEFYYKEKKDMKKALEWITKAVELRGEDAFWMLRMKSLIQAELGDYKGAIETAKKSLAAAEKAQYQAYIDMNKASIEEWSKMKK